MDDGEDHHSGEGYFSFTEAGAYEGGPFLNFAEAIDKGDDDNDDECDKRDWNNDSKACQHICDASEYGGCIHNNILGLWLVLSV